jgi:tripartite-type tricarboxylate transporter receptor subunit TctC
MHRRGILAAVAAAAAPAVAQEAWPTRPIRLLVPYPPGGASDFLGRVVGERMARELGQPIVVENRPGAAGNLGTEIGLRAPPDGYTVTLGAIGTLAVNRFLFRSMPYDADRDAAPITMLALVPNLMVVPPTLPVANVREFTEWARARGTAVNFGSIGNGTSQHLAGVQFNMLTGTAMQHVTYRDPAQVNADLMEGRVHVLFQAIPAVAALARAGRMKALAVSGEERVPAFPEVPTLREAGVDVTTMAWFGLVAPMATPAPILTRIEQAAIVAIRDPAVAARIVDSGAVPRAEGAAAFARFIAAETVRLQAIVRASGAVAD